MGYETTLYIGSKHTSKVYAKDENGIYIKDLKGDLIEVEGKTESALLVMAKIDMCKIGSGKLSDAGALVNHDPNHRVYFYGEDGNTQVDKDRYGDKFVLIPLKDVVKALRADIKNDEYRRLKWAYNLCNSMLKTDREEKFVIFFGH